jgi:hypothetical protein
MAKHVPTLCDQCGQIDDHPKSHWNDGNSYHFDCLPYDKREEFIQSHPLAESLVNAATEGKHGDELRQFSVNLHENYEVDSEKS